MFTNNAEKTNVSGIETIDVADLGDKGRKLISEFKSFNVKCDKSKRKFAFGYLNKIIASEQHEIMAESGNIFLDLINPLNKISNNAPEEIRIKICMG